MKRRMKFEGLEVRKLMTADVGLEADVTETRDGTCSMCTVDVLVSDQNENTREGGEGNDTVQVNGSNTDRDVYVVVGSGVLDDDVFVDGNIITAENYDSALAGDDNDDNGPDGIIWDIDAASVGDREVGDSLAVDTVFAETQIPRMIVGL